MSSNISEQADTEVIKSERNKSSRISSSSDRRKQLSKTDNIVVNEDANPPFVERQPATTTKSIEMIDANRVAEPIMSQSQKSIMIGRFFSVSITGSIENGYFNSVNDVYIKYSILAGPDWILASGSDMGITQISRFRLNSKNKQQFTFNQPIAINYRSYNYYGWPQIVVSVYNFDTFGNDQVLGYGCYHLPLTNNLPRDYRHIIRIYSPQSSSLTKQLLAWITGRRPELIDSNVFARGDCRRVLQTVTVGELELTFNLTTKDVQNNNYASG